MILANYGVVSSSGGAINYDADALAFMTAAAITDNTQKTAINTLVTDLKTYNIWTKMKALYPFVGGSASSHKWNLKDPRDLDAAYRLVFSGGWTHSSTGALPNGTTGWATTYFNPSTMLANPNTSNHLAIYLRTNINEAAVDAGSFTNPGLGYDIESRIVNMHYSFNGVTATTTSFANTDSRGLHVNTRQGTTTHKVFINSTLKTTNTGTIVGLPNVNIALATRFNSSLGTPETYSSKEQAFASMGDGLSDTEVANFYTAVQSFNTLLARNV